MMGSGNGERDGLDTKARPIPGVPGSGARLPGLDGIRGLAALMVFAFHFFQVNAADASDGALLARLAAPGQTGVDLFFLLSGFLITGILLQNRGADRALATFYARRVLRIFPVYYLALLGLIVAGGISNDASAIAASDAWWYVIYLQNIPWTFSSSISGPGHLWSLAVEEQFYLAWPLLVFGVSTRRLVQTCVALIVAGIATRAYFVLQGWTTFYFTLCRMDGLVTGALLAVAFHQREHWARVAATAARVAVAVALIGVPCSLWFLGRGSDAFAVFKPLMMALLYGGLVAATIQASPLSPIARFFSLWPLRVTGKFSYAFYVAHPMAIAATGVVSRNLGISLALALTATYSIAIASWYAIERPILRLKERLPTVPLDVAAQTQSMNAAPVA